MWVIESLTGGLSRTGGGGGIPSRRRSTRRGSRRTHRTSAGMCLSVRRRLVSSAAATDVHTNAKRPDIDLSGKPHQRVTQINDLLERPAAKKVLLAVDARLAHRPSLNRGRARESLPHKSASQDRPQRPLSCKIDSSSAPIFSPLQRPIGSSQMTPERVEFIVFICGLDVLLLS